MYVENLEGPGSHQQEGRRRQLQQRWLPLWQVPVTVLPWSCLAVARSCPAALGRPSRLHLPVLSHSEHQVLPLWGSPRADCLPLSCQLGLQRILSQAELSVVQNGLHSLLFWLNPLGLLAQARPVWEIPNRSGRFPWRATGASRQKGCSQKESWHCLGQKECPAALLQHQERFRCSQEVLQLPCQSSALACLLESLCLSDW